MKRINATNLVHFYGLSPHDGVEMGILCEVVARGSMTDIMASDRVKFDLALKNSVIKDLTNVGRKFSRKVLQPFLFVTNTL